MGLPQGVPDALPLGTMDVEEQHRRILAKSRVCHLCGHDGADAVDHIVPKSRGGGEESSNKAPAHHFVPCPTCGIKCNRVKFNKLLAPIPLRSSSFTWPDQT